MAALEARNIEEWVRAAQRPWLSYLAQKVGQASCLGRQFMSEKRASLSGSWLHATKTPSFRIVQLDALTMNCDQRMTAAVPALIYKRVCSV